MSLSNPKIKLLLLSLMHFATDGLCAYLIFTRLYPNNPEALFAVFLVYNLMAFVTQSPIGMLIDRYNRPRLFLTLSMAAMILGYIFGGLWILSVFFVGLGNSLFHVVGGKYVTEKSGNDISHLGIFVSTGAVGLGLGQHYATLSALAYVLFGVFIFCGLIMSLSEEPEAREYFEEYKPDQNGTQNGAILAFASVVAVVFLRSFVGKVATFDFEAAKHLLLLISVAAALGKAMGGVVSKRFGIVPTTIASMSASAACLTFFNSNPYFYILGVFAFNFSMPITLYYANVMLKGKEGFAFGTLAT